MALWPTGTICIPICTFHTFTTIWDDHFPLMKIQKPSEDICLQCHFLKNPFKYVSEQSNVKGSRVISDINHERNYCSDGSTVCLPKSPVFYLIELGEQIVLKSTRNVQ